jgi:uncharacterized membrane protein YgcG
MSYQRVRCPNGHTFMASVTSRFSRVQCAQCASDNAARKRSIETSYATPTDTSSFDFSSDQASQSDTSSSSSTSDFSSGGGGDFGGGGASGDY